MIQKLLADVREEKERDRRKRSRVGRWGSRKREEEKFI